MFWNHLIFCFSKDFHLCWSYLLSVFHIIYCEVSIQSYLTKWGDGLGVLNVLKLQLSLLQAVRTDGSQFIIAGAIFEGVSYSSYSVIGDVLILMTSNLIGKALLRIKFVDRLV